MSLFYDGVHYEIETEGDIEPINLLSEDEQEYNSQVSNISNDFQESYWTSKVMHIFLDECIKRKMLIRDPNIQKQKIFFSIHKHMKAKGYNFKVITLERKLRSMKKHYMILRENSKDPLLKRPNWQYYDKMSALYPDNSEKVRPTVPAWSETQQEKSNLYHAGQADYCENPNPTTNTDHTSQESSVTQLILNDYSPSLITAFNCDREDEKPRNRNNFEKPTNIEILKKKILNLEERRTVATEKILAELRQANKLKEEMLELNIKLFEETKNMEEY